MSQSAADHLARRVLAADPRQPCDVLGLARGASLEDARRAYRLLAKDLHPDKNGSALALEAFRRCGEAKDQLEQALSGNTAAAARPSSPRCAWAAFTDIRAAQPAAAPPRSRAATGSVGSDAAAWGSRPQAPQAVAARSAWGAGPPAHDGTAHTGSASRQANAVEQHQQQQQQHAQPASCSSDSDSRGPDRGSDGGTPSPPPSARAADMRTSWNPQPRGQQRRASQLFTGHGGSLPASLASGRSQHSSLPVSAPQPAARLGSWLDAVPPSPPPDRGTSGRHDHSSWSPSRRQSDAADRSAAGFAESPSQQAQRGWLPPPRARRPLAATGGLFADDAAPGPSSPVMCSLPDGSQHSLQRSPAAGAAGVNCGGDAAIVLDESDSEGAPAAAFGSAPADVLDDDEEPLAEFHWASQLEARSSLSQPLPGGRRRSSITTGSRGDALDDYGLGNGQLQDREPAAPERRPLQSASRLDVWRRGSSSSPSQRHSGAAAPLGGASQNELQTQHASPGSCKARWAAAPRQRAVPASLPSGGDFLIGGSTAGGGSAARSTAGADARAGSGDRPAAAQQRRKRVLAVESDSEDEVPDVAHAVSGVSPLKQKRQEAGKGSKPGGKPSASSAAALRQRVLGGSANTRVLPHAFEAAEAALDQRQAALKEQTAAVARQKAASAKQHVLARVHGRQRGCGRVVRAHGLWRNRGC